MLDAALLKAKTQALVPPVEDRIAQCVKFVERAKKRLAVAETEFQSAVQKKSQCEQEVAEGEADLVRMREEVPVPADPDEDANKGQIGSIGVDPRPSTTRVSGSSRQHPFKGGKTSSGVLCRRCVAFNGARFGLLVGRQTSGTPGWTWETRSPHHNHWTDLKRTRQVGKFLSAPICSVEHGPMRRVVSRYGLRGVRVGEASHPGPRRPRQVRSSSVESSWSGPDCALRDDGERNLLDLDVVRTVGAQVDASSDNEPLMRPSSGGHVVPERVGKSSTKWQKWANLVRLTSVHEVSTLDQAIEDAWLWKLRLGSSMPVQLLCRIT